MQPLELLRTAHSQRVQRSSERLRIEAAIADDAARYVCRLQRRGDQGGSGGTAMLQLRVQRPQIELVVIDVGAHYAALGWNASLDIAWTANVALRMAVRDSHNATIRIVQLNILNP